MASATRPTVSEEEIDDLLYFARAGETTDFTTFLDELCTRENCSKADLLAVVKDETTGNGPLHMGSANGHVEIITAILKALNLLPLTNTTNENGANANSSDLDDALRLINAPNLAGNTPLHYAAINGHLEAVKKLMDAGVDVTVKNSAGHDAIYEAEVAGKTEVVEWVLSEGEGIDDVTGGAEEGNAESADVDDAEGAETGDGEGKLDDAESKMEELKLEGEEKK